jgi:23S rRNA U2552 (ribose-2'-O)-methylase RlmE/FtsJ
MDYKVIELWGTGGPPKENLTLFTGKYTKKAPFYTPESKVLQQCKNMIDNFYEEGKWDDYKKITNPYEYIFLSWNRRTSRSVAIRQPLSRSFFKMIELWKSIEITDAIQTLIKRDGGLVTAHSAEGPGGFIEACTVICEKQAWEFKHSTAITLRSEAKNVPGWRKANRFLETWPQIEIHDGADGTGNILSPANREAFVKRTLEKSPNGVHVYTADGGFDFSSDFNAQEDTVMPLLFAEVYLGLRVLTKGGILVIKCFDTTEQSTLDLIWIMSRAFCTWGVLKPCTSRAGNAERYLVGKGFLGNADDILKILEQYMAQGDYERPVITSPTCSNYKEMIQQLYEIQCAIEHTEIEVIQDTLSLIKKAENGLIKRLVRDNVIRSIQWCEKHEEPVATFWLTELDRNVVKECLDLNHILNPVHQPQYSRPPIVSTVSFEGFRSGVMPTTINVNNPFNRTK